jgi:serine/threonine-protein kinase
MIGTSVQRYEILEELGQGGMSVVYRGRDPDLGRDVAIKVLHSHLAGKTENRQRFRREAQAIARLRHPHIVDVFDYSREEDDHAFIVMEYIPGQTLREWCDTHGHPPSEVAVMIGVVLANALSHAHDHGVIHRDLKPENVMVSDDGTLTLMDFGIAHVADAETMTQTGSLLGSPAHMAPEIIDGAPVNRRSDIFSVGTVLYWLACGQFPFDGENATQLLRQVLDCNFTDPSEINPKISPGLEQVICRCLSRDPEDRFASVDALQEALVDALETVAPSEVESELNAYFEDPAAYTQRYEEDVVKRIVARGNALADEGEIPAAMSQFNRALAYDPTHPEVNAALDRLNRQSKTPQYVAGAVALVAVFGAGMWWMLSESTVPDTRAEASSRVVDALEVAEDRAWKQEARIDGRSVAASTLNHVAEQVSRLQGQTQAASTQLAAKLIAQDASAPRIVAAVSAPTPDPPTGVGPAPAVADPKEPSSTADVGVADAAEPEEPTFTYRFNISPLAATVYLDDRKLSAPAAMRGVELKRGLHRIRVTSPGCHPVERTFRVDGPASDRMKIALEWRDAAVRVDSNRAAVVYLDGDTSKPYPIGSDGKNAQIRIPFGEVESDRRTSRREVTLEVRPRENLQIVRRRTVSVRPGERATVRITFPSNDSL